jgi:hypothetical protein
MNRAALALLTGLLLAACGSSSQTPTGHTTSTSPTSTTSAATTWRALRSVHITVAQPGLPPPGGQPKTESFTTASQLARVTAALNRYHISQKVPPTPSHGCAGGHQITITIVRQSGQTVNLSAYRCAGGISGNIAGGLTGFLAAVKAPQ